jgi:hypothetical protein
VWVLANDGAARGRRQVARGGYRTKWEALSAERRFLIEFEDDATTPTQPIGPTAGEFLVEWLVSSSDIETARELLTKALTAVAAYGYSNVERRAAEALQDLA